MFFVIVIESDGECLLYKMYNKKTYIESDPPTRLQGTERQCTESLNGKDLPPTRYTKGVIMFNLLCYYVTIAYEAGESLNESNGEESIYY